MAQESALYCRDCHRYDAENATCKDGKVNPPSWETAVTVSQVLGLRSICTFNDFRERLVHCRKNVTVPPENRSPEKRS
jgi:hypothetical protein